MRTRNLLLAALLAALFLLAVVHALLPALALHYLNRQMAVMGDYTGHVESLELGLLRGAATLGDLRIEARAERIEVPILVAPRIAIDLNWGESWRRRGLVAEIHLQEPTFNYLADVELGEPPPPDAPDWRTSLREAFPVTLSEVRVDDGTFSYRLYGSDPPIHLRVTALALEVHNLTNASRRDDKRFADFRATGTVQQSGALEASGRIDPLSDLDFELKARVTGLQLTSLNDLTRAYGNFDFAAGTGDVVVEVDIADRNLDGYVKPLLHEASIFNVEQDVKNDDKGVFRAAWEALVGAARRITENPEQDQFATEVPLRGRLGDAETSPLQAFLAILRNGFIEAFTARYGRESGTADQ